MKRRMGVKQSLITGLGAAVCLQASALAAHAGNMPPFKVQGVEFTPYAGTFGGYSTNPDEVPDGKASTFIQFDAGLKAAMTVGASKLKAEVNGTILNYDGLDKDYRWLYEVKASGETQLTGNDLLEYDIRRRRDNLDDKYDELSHRVRAFWTHTAKDFEVKLGASFRNKDFLEPATHNEFDYLMPGVELTLRAMPEADVSPFLVLRGAKLDYLNQIESIIDRDAVNYSVTGGLRWQPAKSLQIDAGARYNLRVLEDQTYARIDNGFADLQLTWKPSDQLAVKAAVWRELAEPYKNAGVAVDQTNYELGLVLKPTERWQFETKSTLQWEHEIGTNIDSANIEVTAAGYYAINASLRGFLKGRQLWESDRNTDDHTTIRSSTTEVLVGFDTSF